MNTYSKLAFALVGSLVATACGPDASDSDDVAQTEPIAQLGDAGASPALGSPATAPAVGPGASLPVSADAGRPLQHDAGSAYDDDEDSDDEDGGYDPLPTNTGTAGGSTSKPVSGGVTAPTTASVAGTWAGTLNGQSGQLAAKVTFSAAGYFVLHGTELRSPGQVVRYVPSGGGIQKFTLISMSGAGNQLQLVIDGSFEKGGDGYVDRSANEETYDFELTPSGLQVRLSEQSASNLGNGDVSASGSGTQVWTGLLTRQ